MQDYIPIAWAAHELLEFAVLRRQKLRLRMRTEEGSEMDSVVRPTDVQTRDRAEWLSYVREQGEAGIVRLDRIISAKPA